MWGTGIPLGASTSIAGETKAEAGFSSFSGCHWNEASSIVSFGIPVLPRQRDSSPVPCGLWSVFQALTGPEVQMHFCCLPGWPAGPGWGELLWQRRELELCFECVKPQSPLVNSISITVRGRDCLGQT